MDNVALGKLVIGTRLACKSNGPGIVYAICGELLQDAACAAQDLTHGGATLDIVFEQGMIARDVPEMFIRRTGWEIHKEVVSPEDIAQALAVAACATASKLAAGAEQLAIDRAYNAEIERLSTAPEYHHLDQGNDPHSGILAARNIRTALKLVFPGTRFSVRRKAYGNVTVNWKDGPCSEQVEAVVRRYRAGRYNANAGAYEYSRQPWAAVFGAAKYINVVREESEELVEKAIDALFTRCAASLVGIAKPAASTYKGGGLCGIEVPGFDLDLQLLLRYEVAIMTL
jgi:hypothetical protein